MIQCGPDTLKPQHTFLEVCLFVNLAKATLPVGSSCGPGHTCVSKVGIRTNWARSRVFVHRCECNHSNLHDHFQNSSETICPARILYSAHPDILRAHFRGKREKKQANFEKRLKTSCWLSQHTNNSVQFNSPF